MKAIVLVSGGLDSILAVRAIKEQEIDPVAVHFHMPFVKPTEQQVRDKLHKNVVEQVGCRLRFEVVHDEYMQMFKSPKYGYGKNLNPCIDCKILFLTLARRIMDQEGASFVATGEVVGQRPMSQQKSTLRQIEKNCGLDGLLVRPLSALCMPETIPQKEGWLKPHKLFAMNGRTRTAQIKLAEKWGICEYPAPAGGCLLTDPCFSRRLRDLMDHGDLNMRNIEFLKAGRHVRIADDLILTVGKDEPDNDRIESMIDVSDYVFTADELPGPMAVARGSMDEERKKLCASIVVRYTKAADRINVSMAHNGGKEIIMADKIDDGVLREMIV